MTPAAAAIAASTARITNDEATHQSSTAACKGASGGPAGIEVVLQNHGGGGSVEPGLALAPIALVHGEPALGLVAAQPLVLQHDGHGDAGA